MAYVTLRNRARISKGVPTHHFVENIQFSIPIAIVIYEKLRGYSI